ncbi:hypothetical protein L596_014342 [Steinernema carpocapsae]|uniref:Uncharacterized protein n=1 Tax=Steinernema carpocapsae TaxID=34508 RepID=A0A4U5NBV3_STECR|nr:hypothetical protein L596_014342 [Steinernema carpocapsae]
MCTSTVKHDNIRRFGDNELKKRFERGQCLLLAETGLETSALRASAVLLEAILEGRQTLLDASAGASASAGCPLHRLLSCVVLLLLRGVVFGQAVQRVRAFALLRLVLRDAAVLHSLAALAGLRSLGSTRVAGGSSLFVLRLVHLDDVV